MTAPANAVAVVTLPLDRLELGYLWVLLQTNGVPAGKGAGDVIDVVYGLRNKLDQARKLMETPPPPTAEEPTNGVPTPPVEVEAPKQPEGVAAGA